MRFSERPGTIRLPQFAVGLLATLLLAGCNDGDRIALIEESGLQTITSSGIEREFYVQLPPGYTPLEGNWPLMFAVHGSGDSYQGWMAGGFQGDGLITLAGDEAIIVLPNGRFGADGRRTWDAGGDTDFDFFLDMLSYLDQRVNYDPKRIFVTGHSAGALMAHELGCRFGDIFRGVAPSAGSITSSLTPTCVGSTAVLQMQSEFDEIVPPTVVTDTRDIWTLYNGFELDVSVAIAPDPCIDYSLGGSLYPVHWCLHDTTDSDGHGWWTEADQAIWAFFSGLPIADPTTDAPPGGGNDRLVQLYPDTMTITVEMPADIPPPVLSGLLLYADGTPLPISGAPQYILGGVDLSGQTPGTQQTYTVAVQLPSADALPASFVFVLIVYVEGGSSPIPTPGVDHVAVYPLQIDAGDTAIVIPDILVLEPV